MNIYEKLTLLSYPQFHDIWNAHLEWAKTNNRIAGNPQWFERGLNIIGIRCNTESDFNFGKYNDYLILIQSKPESYDQNIFTVTVDPNRMKYAIAHLRQGVYNSYVIRPHKWATRVFPKIGLQSRWAICQDKDKVAIVRTDGKGKILSEEWGLYGINIHDGGGYADSSAGCTVEDNDLDYVDRLLPMIYDIKAQKPVPVNHDNLTYCLINHSQFETYAGTTDRVEKAQAVNGHNYIPVKEAKKAT